MGIVQSSPMGVSFPKKVKLIFPDYLIKHPLVYEMSQVYDIVTNIEQANIDGTEGWVIMEVNGTGDEIDKACKWMANQGVCVQTMLPGF